MRENKKAYVFLRFACSGEEGSKFICMDSFFWCRKINLSGDSETRKQQMKELSSTKLSNVKRFALISNYLPLQARVGSPASLPRLISLVKTSELPERESERWSHNKIPF